MELHLNWCGTVKNEKATRSCNLIIVVLAYESWYGIASAVYARAIV